MDSGRTFGSGAVVEAGDDGRQQADAEDDDAAADEHERLRPAVFAVQEDGEPRREGPESESEEEAGSVHRRSDAATEQKAGEHGRARVPAGAEATFKSPAVHGWRMDRTRTGGLAAVVGLAVLVVAKGPGLVVEAFVPASVAAGTVPTVGTTGLTVTLYALAADAVAAAGPVALAVGLGYVVGDGVVLGREWRAFLQTLALGAAAGVAGALAMVAAVGVARGTTAISPETLLLSVGWVAAALARVVATVVVGGLAGAALVALRSGSWGDGQASPASAVREAD